MITKFLINKIVFKKIFSNKCNLSNIPLALNKLKAVRDQYFLSYI